MVYVATEEGVLVALVIGSLAGILAGFVLSHITYR